MEVYQFHITERSFILEYSIVSSDVNRFRVTKLILSCH
jgi:hypothetical protein